MQEPCLQLRGPGTPFLSTYTACTRPEGNMELVTSSGLLNSALSSSSNIVFVYMCMHACVCEYMCVLVYVFMVVGGGRSQKTGYYIFAEEAGNLTRSRVVLSLGSSLEDRLPDRKWGALWRTGSLTGSGEFSGGQAPQKEVSMFCRAFTSFLLLPVNMSGTP